jgi:NAD(P)-dependent dehydrogenase (short-subunit alcohol dehydrogenase family)
VGISAEVFGTGKPSTTTEETIHRTFETNFFAPVALTKELLPVLKKSDAGQADLSDFRRQSVSGAFQNGAESQCWVGAR